MRGRCARSTTAQPTAGPSSASAERCDARPPGQRTRTNGERRQPRHHRQRRLDVGSPQPAIQIVQKLDERIDDVNRDQQDDCQLPLCCRPAAARATANVTASATAAVAILIGSHRASSTPACRRICLRDAPRQMDLQSRISRDADHPPQRRAESEDAEILGRQPACGQHGEQKEGGPWRPRPRSRDTRRALSVSSCASATGRFGAPEISHRERVFPAP